jgi:UDP-2-acetamido-2,6-beta-L-arabino-hexul-4-ose reductase
VAKILVTGSKGFIGSELISYLAKKGYDVTGTNADIRNIDTLRPYFENIEFVIHAAAKTKNIKTQEDYYTVNVMGTKNVLELCLKNGCKLIHLSSVAINEGYGTSKQMSQKLVEEYSTRGLKVVILRLCHIIGKNDNPKKNEIWYPLENLLRDIEDIIKVHDFNKYEKLISLY